MERMVTIIKQSAYRNSDWLCRLSTKKEAVQMYLGHSVMKNVLMWVQIGNLKKKILWIIPGGVHRNHMGITYFPIRVWCCPPCTMVMTSGFCHVGPVSSHGCSMVIKFVRCLWDYVILFTGFLKLYRVIDSYYKSQFQSINYISLDLQLLIGFRVTIA